MITGGAGFLGRRLIRALCDRGRLTDATGRERSIERIVATDRVGGVTLRLDECIACAEGAIADAAFVPRALGGDADSVFLLAAAASLGLGAG